jgi:hypothetical protein
VFELKKKLQEKKLNAIPPIAHKLKGTALTLCCARLAEISSDLEKSDTTDFGSLNQMILAIEEEIEILKALIPKRE